MNNQKTIAGRSKSIPSEKRRIVGRENPATGRLSLFSIGVGVEVTFAFNVGVGVLVGFIVGVMEADFVGVTLMLGVGDGVESLTVGVRET